MIAEKVNDYFLPSGAGEDDIYEELSFENPLDFEKFDFKVLSEKLGDEVEFIETNRDCDGWYSIFKYKNIYFAFYSFGGTNTKIKIISSKDDAGIYTYLC